MVPSYGPPILPMRQRSAEVKVKIVANRSSAPRDGTPKIVDEVIQTSFRLPRSRWQRLQHLVIEERSSVQAIVVEALEAAFEKRGKSL